MNGESDAYCTDRPGRRPTLMSKLASNDLVGSICVIKPSGELLLLPSCHSTSTSYTRDYYKLTHKVRVGLCMCVSAWAEIKVSNESV